MADVVIRMVGGKLVVEFSLVKVLEAVAGNGKLALEIAAAEVIQAVRDAAAKPCSVKREGLCPVYALRCRAAHLDQGKERRERERSRNLHRKPTPQWKENRHEWVLQNHLVGRS